MKKILFVCFGAIFFIPLFASAPPKLCSTSCVTGEFDNGNTVYSSGYSWYQPDGTTCSSQYLVNHYTTTTIHYSDVLTSGGQSQTIDAGTCSIEDVQCLANNNN